MKRAIFVCVLVILMICGCVTAMALTQQDEVTVASSTNYSVGGYRDVVIEPLKSKTFSVKRPIVEKTSYAGYQCTSYKIIGETPNTNKQTFVYVLDENGRTRSVKTQFTGIGIYSIKYNNGNKPMKPYPETEKMKLVVENYANDYDLSLFFDFQSTALWSPNRQAFV
ncbi:MAG: hypothetical protein L6V89_09035 [Oscillospiraceae bacterium]|nr:MAG: hypothetical protein L6V89_09035 [Oscillospiraceae bacterium]